MLVASSLARFSHLPTSMKDKIVILLQSDNFIEARQLYDQAIEEGLIEKMPLCPIAKNEDYYE